MRTDCSLSRSVFNRFAHSNRRLLCSSRSGVTCHSPTRCAAACQPSTPNYGSTSRPSLILGAGIWLSRNRRELIALTARAHYQSIHRYRMLISRFGLHEREENQYLIPLGKVAISASRIKRTTCDMGISQQESHGVLVYSIMRSCTSRVLYAVLPALPLPASFSFNSARTLRANSIGRNGFSR